MHSGSDRRRRSSVASNATGGIKSSALLSQLYRQKNFKQMQDPEVVAREEMAMARFCTFDSDFLDLTNLGPSRLLIDLN
jgi:hypothetical protein